MFQERRDLILGTFRKLDNGHYFSVFVEFLIFLSKCYAKTRTDVDSLKKFDLVSHFFSL